MDSSISMGKADKMKSEAMQFMESVVGPVTIGMMIRAYRTTNDLTQLQLAKKLKVRVSYVSDLENDRKDISLIQARDIAKKLGESDKLYVRIWMEQKAREAGLDFDSIVSSIPTPRTKPNFPIHSPASLQKSQYSSKATRKYAKKATKKLG